VPANLRCGRPEREAPAGEEQDWAPLSYTFAGIWELQPHWLEENLGRVQVVDVREPEEFTGELGHVGGALLVPLDALERRLPKLVGYVDRDVVLVCRAGARSGSAAAMLRRAGFRRVHNLDGGMLAWHAAGLPVQR
jgi:rhodanese-related sulfurtransferase